MPLHNIAVLGEIGVGKHAFLKRQTKGEFLEHKESQNHFEYLKQKNSVKYWLKLPGGDKQASMRQSCYKTYRNLNVIIFLFSLDDEASFQKTRDYYTEVQNYPFKKKPQLVLVGNKKDQGSVILKDTIEAFISETGLPYFPISVKTKEGMEALNQHLETLNPKTQEKQSRPTRQKMREQNALALRKSKRISLAKKRYDHFWKTSLKKDNQLKNIRCILANYCAYIPPSCFCCFPSNWISNLILFFTGHWRRHHLKDVRQMIYDIDHHTLNSTKAVIERYQMLRSTQFNAFNREGSLSMRMTFILHKCSQPNAQVGIDEDEDEFYQKECCSVLSG